MATVGQSTISKRPRLNSAAYSMSDVCGLLDISYTKAWEMVQAGTFPVTPIRVGRQYRFPKALVDRLLGIEGDDAAA
jgi:excisionase family DNA binding protein